MILAHKIELSPTAAQRVYFAKACGVARFSYNWALAEWERQYKAGEKPTKYGLVKLQNSIKGKEFPWMSEVTKCAPQYAIHNLEKAFKNFFRDCKKPKTQRRFHYPKFKHKGKHDSFRAAEKEANVILKNFKIRFPKIGWIKMCENLRFKGKILFVTISRTADKWFATFQIETEIKSIVRENQSSIGVDLGIKNLATLSDGTVFENPKALRSKLGKLRRLSKSLSRKTNGSSNRQKAKMKLAKLHYQISCVRSYALHQVTTYLTKNYPLIGAETLNVRGMLKNRKLARAISDVGFGEFSRQLQYKSEWYGSKIVWADLFFPSSKMCSNCWCINDNLTLNDREWMCEACHTHHDRDTNAAINLKTLAEKSSVTACGDDVRLDFTIQQSSMKQEFETRKVG